MFDEDLELRDFVRILRSHKPDPQARINFLMQFLGEDVIDQTVLMFLLVGSCTELACMKKFRGKQIAESAARMLGYESPAGPPVKVGPRIQEPPPELDDPRWLPDGMD